jgi:hypothetical protein
MSGRESAATGSRIGTVLTWSTVETHAMMTRLKQTAVLDEMTDIHIIFNITAGLPHHRSGEW